MEMTQETVLKKEKAKTVRGHFQRLHSHCPCRRSSHLPVRIFRQKTQASRGSRESGTPVIGKSTVNWAGGPVPEPSKDMGAWNEMFGCHTKAVCEESHKRHIVWSSMRHAAQKFGANQWQHHNPIQQSMQYPMYFCWLLPSSVWLCTFFHEQLPGRAFLSSGNWIP